MKLPTPIRDRILGETRTQKRSRVAAGRTAEQTHPEYATLRKLIWLYFWLLIFEGALRKWILPQLSNPLLVVRDPIVILIYLAAVAKRAFPHNGFIWLSLLLAFANTVASLLVGQFNAIIILYGLRTCFLHVPLIFLIPKVFDLRDVEKLSKYLLLTAVPMAVLVVFQFRSEPDSWINTSVTAEATQLTVGFGKIRPPGTFSFTNGLLCYLALLVAFLLSKLIKADSGGRKVTLAAIPATVIMIGTAGSRGVLGCVALILLGTAYVCLRKPIFFGRGVRAACLLGFAFVALQFRHEFRTGMDIYEERITTSGGVRDGLIVRQMQDFLQPFAAISETPALGYGIGMGTPVASQLLWGKRRLIFSEGEWERLVRESGPFLGLAYIATRVGILLVVLMGASRALSNDNPLPMLLFFAISPNVLTGQWAVPTALGFATFGAGICLAAANPARESGPAPSFRISPESATDPNRKVRGRSIYSEKLHGR